MARPQRVTEMLRSWRNMHRRCGNPSDRGYRYYGARGIKVCERWNDFERFLADMGFRPVGMSIDRIDNDKGYEPSNCRWADRNTQARNRRTARHVELNGETVRLYDAAARLGKASATLLKRARAGVPIDELRGRKLSEPTVTAIRARVGESPTILGREYGVSRQTINAIRRGATW